MNEASCLPCDLSFTPKSGGKCFAPGGNFEYKGWEIMIENISLTLLAGLGHAHGWDQTF